MKRTVSRAQAAAVAAAIAASALASAPLGAFTIPLTPSSAQVWVAGRQIQFSHLAISYGDPVAPAEDPGITAMLDAVAAHASWQPGTRYVAVTRADGKLVTMTLGSNAMTVDGRPVSMPFAPFADNSRFYVPLLPLARALNLGVRGFRGGYVFVPQIVSIAARTDSGATTIDITGSAPMAWRSVFAGNAKARTLTLSFAGFGTDASSLDKIGGGMARQAVVSESGPPGYPTTSVAISIAHGVKYAAHRVGAGVEVQVEFARSEAALANHNATANGFNSSATISTAHLDTRPIATAVPATPPPTLTPAMPPESPNPSPAQSPGEVPAPNGSESPSSVATAEPLGPEPVESQSPSSSPAVPEEKILDVALVAAPTGSRIVLTLSGPVTFEWHRLADPDNRYWLDIHGATLVGPARSLAPSQSFVKEVKVSQHLIVPERVVRVSITPTQPIDVVVGSIEGSPNQLGVEIENQPPVPDAPNAGAGSVGVVVAATSPPSSEPVPTQPNLIVIDPGHGGNDPGSLNPGYGLTESRLTLSISLKLAADLRRRGWQVTLTREGDYEVGDPNGADDQELQARCDVANAAGARLFVSVHINSSVSSTPNGTTTYYWRPADRSFAQAVQSAEVAADGIADDGVKRESFYVIHHTKMTAILVETAYLSNGHDATLLTRSSFLDELATGIANGIDAYTGGPPPASMR